jgi:hypothetical protein
VHLRSPPRQERAEGGERFGGGGAVALSGCVALGERVQRVKRLEGRVDGPPSSLLLWARRTPAMVKLFQGDAQSVQNDVNSWIEVYKPTIRDFKQSLIVMEHSLIVLLTFLYEVGAETEKVQYKISAAKK